MSRMDLNIVVYTMKGCPFCVDLKDMLIKEGVEFYDRDIEEYKEEYDLFVEITNNDMIPSLLVIEGDEKKYKSYLYAPDKNFNELTEAVDIIKKHRKRVGLF